MPATNIMLTPSVVVKAASKRREPRQRDTKGERGAPPVIRHPAYQRKYQQRPKDAQATVLQNWGQ